MKTPPTFVSHIGAYIFIEQCAGLETQLAALGFVEDREVSSSLHRYQKKAPADKEELAVVLDQLRRNNIAFSWGKDWSPAAIVEQLKEEGFLFGKFLAIGWGGPGDWRVSEI
jgi:hypothetical protein